MSHTKPVIAALIAAGALGAGSASAQQSWSDLVTVSGFGTLGVVRTNNDEGQYRREQQPKGATKQASLLTDSNLGLQVNARVQPWLTATVQALAGQRTESKLEPRIEMAYIKLMPADGLSLRAGRLNLPTFMISDSRRIGYANTTLRPSDEVYGLDILNGGLTGVEGSWRVPIAGHGLTVTLVGGRTRYLDPSADPTKVNGVRGINVVLDGDGYQFRLGRVEASPDLSGLASILEPMLGTGQKLGDEKYKFSGAGFSVDRGLLVLQGEYVQRRSTLFNPRVGGNAWYLMAGWRFDTLLPYVQTARRTPVDNSSGFTFPQKSMAAGVRWDAYPKVAFKTQLERINTSSTAGASFFTPEQTTQFGPVPMPITRPVTTVSVAVDFMF